MTDAAHSMLIPKVGIVVLARMGSSRLPGKALTPIAGRELLGVILDRVRYLAPRIPLTVATTINSEDQAIEDFCCLEGVTCFRGSELMVADRLIEASQAMSLDYAVRMNGDRPLFDDENLLFAIRLAETGQYDFISNKLVGCPPVTPGMTTEAISISRLQELLDNFGSEEDQEHVTTVMYRRQSAINCFPLTGELSYNPERLPLPSYAVDTPEDVDRAENIFLKAKKMKSLRISEFTAAAATSPQSSKQEPFLIAEIGGNHEGDFEYARRLTELAVRSPAHSVKFQLYTGDTLVNSEVSPDRHRHFKKFELDVEQHETLAKICIEGGKIYSASVWNEVHLEALDPYMGYYKIGSGDLTNWELLKKFAVREKPIVLSTGLAWLGEAVQVVEYLRKISSFYAEPGSLSVLQCTSMYPIGPEDANLACMDMLRDTLSCDVGYSDHTVGTQALKAAISMGAEALEFHFTDDREGKDFRDQKCSKTLDEVAEVYEHILEHRQLEGSAIKKPTEIEIATDHVSSFRRAAYYSRDLCKGTTVAEDDICFLRPVGKLHPYIATKRLVGAKLTVDVKSRQEVDLQHIS